MRGGAPRGRECLSVYASLPTLGIYALLPTPGTPTHPADTVCMQRTAVRCLQPAHGALGSVLRFSSGGPAAAGPLCAEVSTVRGTARGRARSGSRARSDKDWIASG